MSEKIKLLEVMGNRLSHLHSHDALSLLRHSFAIPKMLHILRTAPCFNSPRLHDYDNLLRSILSRISNIRFEDNDQSWLQATLPVNMGGLGIRSAVHLAPSILLRPPSWHQLMAHLILSTRYYPTGSTTLSTMREWRRVINGRLV